MTSQRKWITCLVSLCLSFAALIAGKMDGGSFVASLGVVVGGYYALNVAEKNVRVNVGQK